MNSKKLVLVTLLMFTVCFAASAKKDLKTGAYLFGLSYSFSDSLVHITNIQYVDSAQVDKSHFLVKRAMYSYQLQNFLGQNKSLEHRTCVIFFSTKKKEIEKKYQKMHKQFSDTLTHQLVELPIGKFKFTKPE